RRTAFAPVVPGPPVMSAAALPARTSVAHRPRFSRRTHHQVVTLDVVHRDPEALRADLEYRLGGTVLALNVTEVDYVRDVTVVDVRYRRHASPDGPDAQVPSSPYPTYAVTDARPGRVVR